MSKTRVSYILISIPLLLGLMNICQHRPANLPEITNQKTEQILRKKLAFFEANLLNLHTFGYRNVDDVLQSPIDGKPVIIRNFEQASLTLTGRPYNIGITGPGFLQFKKQSGELVYSRNGQLSSDRLRNVCHVSGPCIWPKVQITQACSTHIIADGGEILCRLNGQSKKIGQIQLFSFNNNQGLASEDSIWFRETDSSGPPHPIERVSLIEGFLETSNMNEELALKNLKRLKQHLQLVEDNL